MQIEIKRWDNDKTIVCGEYESIRDCLEKNKDISFYRANLSSANLCYANLSSANLSFADLSYANLSSANLSSANLSSADLSSANLSFADLSCADLRYADLSYANLRFADLSYADLSSANLSCADLRYADLSSANLRSANLSCADLLSANLLSANLSSADLRSANLSSAKNLNKFRTTPLYGMLDNETIRAYKIVNSKNVGIYNGGLVYEVGKEVEEKEANTNENKQCGAGINLATLDWCINLWEEGHKILICEFKKEDIACIPIGSDGKFRVYRCKVIGEKNLKDIGLDLLNHSTQ